MFDVGKQVCFNIYCYCSEKQVGNIFQNLNKLN